MAAAKWTHSDPNIMDASYPSQSQNKTQQQQQEQVPPFSDESATLLQLPIKAINPVRKQQQQ